MSIFDVLAVVNRHQIGDLSNHLRFYPHSLEYLLGNFSSYVRMKFDFKSLMADITHIIAPI
ncbi:unnamed protein product, partial [marine sediment metagenome]